MTKIDGTPPDIEGWERSRGWGWVWGDDDEVGALNALNGTTVLNALGEVTEGKTYDLGVTLDGSSFLDAAHCPTEVVAYRTPDGLIKDPESGFDNPDAVSFNTSMIIISDHAGTQLDGLCHATSGTDRHWYNGYSTDNDGHDFGPGRASAEHIPPVITSAVLIDVAGFKGRSELDEGYGITPDDMQRALEAQAVRIRPGDVVLIRTGTLRHWGDVGSAHEDIAGPDTAGITLESARWLVEKQGAILVGADTSTVEVIPPIDGDNASPVHEYLLVDQGVHMGELHYLEDLAADEIYRFCYIALAPKVRGTTAGFAMRPIALI